MAAGLFGTDMAMVGFLAVDREWFKARVGVGRGELPLYDTLNTRLLQGREFVAYSDIDHETESIPIKARLTAQELGWRAFASVPILSPEHHVVGALSVADCVPRSFSTDQLKQLRALAGLVTDRLELRSRRTSAASVSEASEAFDSRCALRDASHWEWEIGRWEPHTSPRFKKIVAGRDFDTPSNDRPWSTWVHPDDRERVLSAVSAHLENSIPFDITYRLRSQEGGYRWIHDEGQAARDDHGRPFLMIGTMTELGKYEIDEKPPEVGGRHPYFKCDCLDTIAELRRMNAGLVVDLKDSRRSEAELKKKLGLFRDVFESLKDEAGASNFQGEASLIERARRALGEETLDARQDSSQGVEAAADQGTASLTDEQQALLQAFQIEWPESDQIPDAPRTRETEIAKVNGVPLANAADILGAVFVKAITDRSLAIEELKKSEERFRQFEENVHEAFWISGPPEGDVTYVSPAFERIWGRDRPDFHQISKVWSDSLHPDDRRRVLSVVNRQTKLGLAWELEYRIVRPDASIRWIRDRGFPIPNETGKVQHIFGIAEDITEQKQAEAEITSLNRRLEKRVARLAALRRVDVAMSTTLDLSVTLDILLEVATEQLEIDAASVLSLDPHSQTMHYIARRGFLQAKNIHTRIRLGEGLSGRVAQERLLIEIPDLADSEWAQMHEPLAADEGFVTYYGFPLLCRGHVRGVLEVHHRRATQLDSEDLYFLEILAGQAAIAIDNSLLFDEWERFNLELVLAYDATIEGWSRALDLRDRETEGHTQRVTEMSERLAATIGLPEQELVHLRRGAMLHDIGKMGIPDSILLKPGPLTPDEQNVMQRHPTYAYEWLSSIAFLRPALDIPYCHHEHWNGSGYPRGLKGEEIPLAARIFTAVDIWDALRSDRPYRTGWPEEDVRKYLAKLSGSVLDPGVVKVFLQVLSESDDPFSHT
ncbi:PAS domain-containing protein [Singulisphaera sp. PoT]|uniref:PAS domain-containing protein n=1 Tax=Singulisphaera sp. PoT TaxID=3411797 RepID=UPI003BF61410